MNRYKGTEEGFMDRAVVTAKGQVVIPSKLRRKFGIKKGTLVSLYERDSEIIIKPITDEYIRRMAGITGTKGKLLKALKQERAKERAVRVAVRVLYSLLDRSNIFHEAIRDKN